MKNVFEITHPLIDHSLTVIRRKETTTEEFRRHAGIVFVEIAEKIRYR